MRRLGRNVKRLAPRGSIWHRLDMGKSIADQQKAKADRLREALRANLRRRKEQGRVPKPVDSDRDKDDTP